MSFLLRKDRPWVIGFAVAGTIALASALLDHSGVRVFVIGADGLEVAFHVAWIAGLLLGGTAACFDELLGTGEFLRQRPRSSQQVAGSRALGCVVVLAAWFLLAPVGAWLVFAMHEGWEHTRWTAWSKLGGTFVVSVSACAIGLAAGTLPCAWLLRLCIAAAWFVAAFVGVFAWSMETMGYNTMWMFVLGHVVVAAVASTTWWISASHTADADLPWPMRVRVSVGVPVVVAVAALWSAVAGAGQAVAVQALHRVYPEIVRHGNDVLLAVTDEGRGLFVVDSDHVRTGTGLDLESGSTEVLERHLPRLMFMCRFDAPRWSRNYDNVYTRNTRVLLAPDGMAWVQDQLSMSFTGQGPDHRPFAAGTRLVEVEDEAVAWDPTMAALWRYDSNMRHFTRVPSPRDDEVIGFGSYRFTSIEDSGLRAAIETATSGRFARTNSGSLVFVRGRKDAYVFRDGALVPVSGLLERSGQQRAGDEHRFAASRVQTYGVEPIEVTCDIAPGDGRSAFSHHFTPRTADERWYAGIAMTWSALRPPVFQVVAHNGTADLSWSWIFDVLILDGRRPWLVGAGALFAAVLSFLVSRRLRGLGAARNSVWFWTGATLLFGLVAAVASVVFERPRAYARREIVGAVPMPRIVTPHRSEVHA